MTTSVKSPSPTSLSYIAALRGVAPRQSDTPFAYIDLNCVDPRYYACLAASNPEGQFIGLVANEQIAMRENTMAMAQGVENVRYIGIPAQSLLDKVATGSISLPQADYIHFDSRYAVYSPEDQARIADLVQKTLKPSGLYNYVYNAYQSVDGPLKFLAQECASQFTGDQLLEFLQDLKTLGGKFLRHQPEIRNCLEAAITQKRPEIFLSLYSGAPHASETLQTINNLVQHEMAFVGSSQIKLNYIELAVPKEAHELLLSCIDNPLYEVIKDYATNSTVRTDLWVRTPVDMSSDIGTLFGRFTFGIAHPAQKIPASVQTESATISLETPLYANLLKLLSLMPATIGDFLEHPLGKSFSASDVLQAVHMLTALDAISCIRGGADYAQKASLEAPRMAGAYNRVVANSMVDQETVLLASPISGHPVSLSARDVLVMQAVHKAGLANSVAELMPELERLAGLLGPIGQLPSHPTADMAQEMVRDVVGDSMVRWYAYGLLSAA